jgi:drug/metabolite transporter (DMT)-like permease
MSVFPSVIGYLVQQMSIKQICPSKTSIFINLTPVFSIILSVLILKEALHSIKFLTTTLIITGVYICRKINNLTMHEGLYKLHVFYF